MDQCVGAALKAAETLVARLGAQTPHRIEDTPARVRPNAGAVALGALPRPGIA